MLYAEYGEMLSKELRSTAGILLDFAHGVKWERRITSIVVLYKLPDTYPFELGALAVVGHEKKRNLIFKKGSNKGVCSLYHFIAAINHPIHID
jgi:hypothetical protein